MCSIVVCVFISCYMDLYNSPNSACTMGFLIVVRVSEVRFKNFAGSGWDPHLGSQSFCSCFTVCVWFLQCFLKVLVKSSIAPLKVVLGAPPGGSRRQSKTNLSIW